MRRTGACHEHRADADISFLTKGKDRLMSAYTLYSMAQFCFALFLVSIPDHPPLLMCSSTILGFFVVFPHHIIPTAMDDYPRANLERLDEYASTASYFRSKFTHKLPAEIPCIIINSPLSFLAQRIVYS